MVKNILELVEMVFSFNVMFSFIVVTDEITTYYMKYAYVNFIKLYSHSNIQELKEINKKI